jgi:TRAP-type uncharacterized transport system substrate-binding protein
MWRFQTEGVRPRRFLWIFLFCLATVLVLAGIWPCQGSAADGGFNTKSPVFGAGCPTCTLYASAEFVREALKLEGKDMRICENCYGPWSSLNIAERRRPPALNEADRRNGITSRFDDPVDFGATSVLNRVEWAYYGTHIYRTNGPYQSTGPHPHMRAIALLEAPIYIVAALHADSGIQSWEELKMRKGLRIAASLSPQEPTIPQAILDYYGLTADIIKANGDTIERDRTESADLILSDNAAFTAADENRFWPSVTLKYKLRFLPLADPLRAKLEKDFLLRQAVMPRSYFPGVDKPVPTVERIGHLIYGRDDMPEQYAYDLARALDRHKDLLQFMYIPIHYNSTMVTHTGAIPLHPGAARYYREVGYLK